MDTKGELSNAQRAPQQDAKHPRDVERDLNPNRMAGQNVGTQGGEREVPIPTAFDVKEIHRALHGFTDDDLKQIPILPEGTRLEQGAVYLDLAGDRREEIKATGGMTVERGHYVIPKDRTPYDLWNRLRGAEKPEQPRGHIRHPE